MGFIKEIQVVRLSVKVQHQIVVICFSVFIVHREAKNTLKFFFPALIFHEDIVYNCSIAAAFLVDLIHQMRDFRLRVVLIPFVGPGVGVQILVLKPAEAEEPQPFLMMRHITLIGAISAVILIIIKGFCILIRV